MPGFPKAASEYANTHKHCRRQTDILKWVHKVQKTSRSVTLSHAHACSYTGPQKDTKAGIGEGGGIYTGPNCQSITFKVTSIMLSCISNFSHVRSYGEFGSTF